MLSAAVVIGTLRVKNNFLFLEVHVSLEIEHCVPLFIARTCISIAIAVMKYFLFLLQLK